MAATEKFIEWISDRKIITFEVSAVQSGRNFGQLLLHSDRNNNTFCVAYGLCLISQLAVRNKKYMNGECDHRLAGLLNLNFNNNVEIK